MTSCHICGSRFADSICVYCTKSVCSSCIVQDKSKCIKCGALKKPPYNFLRRNIHVIMLFIAMWFFAAGFYPFPYLIAVGKPVDFRIMQPVLIATGAMMIPFIFMMYAWKKHPPPP